MPVTIRFAALAAVLAFAPAALAEDCDGEMLSKAVLALETVAADGSQLRDQISVVDAAVAACPDHAWINVIGGEFDLMTYRGLLEAKGQVIDQQALDYLVRGFARSSVYASASDEGQKERYSVGTPPRPAMLTGSFRASSRTALIGALIEIAGIGVVHPYLKGELPLDCDIWMTSDAQQVSYKVKTAADMVLLGLVDKAADVCRSEASQFKRNALAYKANAYIGLVRSGAVTDPEEVERLLLAARKDVNDFIGTDGSANYLFSDANMRELNQLILKHGAGIAGPKVIMRELWFTPEYAGSDVAVRSIALSLGDYWTELAVGNTGATPEEVATERNRFSAYLIALRKQGSEAGFKMETLDMMRRAMTAFQNNEMRAPEAANREAMPDWYFQMMMRIVATE